MRNIGMISASLTRKQTLVRSTTSDYLPLKKYAKSVEHRQGEKCVKNTDMVSASKQESEPYISRAGESVRPATKVVKVTTAEYPSATAKFRQITSSSEKEEDLSPTAAPLVKKHRPNEEDFQTQSRYEYSVVIPITPEQTPSTTKHLVQGPAVEAADKDQDETNPVEPLTKEYFEELKSNIKLDPAPLPTSRFQVIPIVSEDNVHIVSHPSSPDTCHMITNNPNGLQEEVRQDYAAAAANSEETGEEGVIVTDQDEYDPPVNKHCLFGNKKSSGNFMQCSPAVIKESPDNNASVDSLVRGINLSKFSILGNVLCSSFTIIQIIRYKR